MATRTASRQRPKAALDATSRYDRWWNTAVLAAVAGWIVVAALQSPRLPLLCMVAGLGAVGGLLFVRAPASSAKGRRQYAVGASCAAALVLVIVGIGHHPETGLTSVVLLTGFSPRVIRWIAGV
jgi:hypothetical protein